MSYGPIYQVEKLHGELALCRDELGRRVNMAADAADAMLHNAAGEMGRRVGRAEVIEAAWVLRRLLA